MPIALVVEDEMMVALMTSDFLEESGFDHILVAVDNDEAERYLVAQSDITLAVLDLNLNGEDSLRTADALTERAIPFFFVSGYDRRRLPSRFVDHILLQKPFHLTDFTSAITLLTTPHEDVTGL